MIINHVWVICEVLRFPKSYFERHHAVIGTDLLERCANINPHAIVMAYFKDGLTVPLLTWISSHENRIVAILHSEQNFRNLLRW